LDTALAGEESREQAESGLWRWVVPITIFVAALLLFAIEPLIAKMILPWFGGSAAVWMVCLLFFQTALLCGYLYAHLLANIVPRPWQWRLHVLLLIISLAFLPAIPAAHWRPSSSDNPLPLILGLLAATIGLPFVLLASTTPLLTAWCARQSPSAKLTRLYALSNLGSMIALLSYPILVEPMLATRIQALSWSWIYAGFVLLAALGAWQLNARAEFKPSLVTDKDAPPLSALVKLFWLLLPMAASALLLAVTNHILRNIAAIPLLWVVPLALYLLSFVMCFESSRWYWRPAWYAWFAVLSGLMIYVMIGLFLVSTFLPQLIFYLGGFFVCCMVCHGELASLKPQPGHLSAYYLTIAAGGALGGLFVAAVAPLVLSADLDMAIILPATVLLVICVAFWRWPSHWSIRWRNGFLALALLALAIDTGVMMKKERDDFATAIFAERNFYGTLRVSDVGDARMLQNGNVVHGRELLGPELARRPVSYYGPNSGIGLAVKLLQERGPLHIGVIGLGTGTMAAHGRAGDRVTFYEINPAVPDIAKNWFSFIATSGAKTAINMGDARLSLEREPPQGFDLLAIDAFTSDSIPVHLLTREAFAQYWRHLKPDGILAVHVSNLYIDLAPVAAAAAKTGGKAFQLISDDGEGEAEDRSDWMLIAADPGIFKRPPLSTAYLVAVTPAQTPWTDDYSNLWRSLR
jgi:SAM-dependent methyltransferase